MAKPFQQWLASEIPAIGKADPANVGTKALDGANEDGQAGLNDDSTSISPRKRGRPRKDGGS